MLTASKGANAIIMLYPTKMWISLIFFIVTCQLRTCEHNSNKQRRMKLQPVRKHGMDVSI